MLRKSAAKFDRISLWCDINSAPSPHWHGIRSHHFSSVGNCSLFINLFVWKFTNRRVVVVQITIYIGKGKGNHIWIYMLPCRARMLGSFFRTRPLSSDCYGRNTRRREMWAVHDYRPLLRGIAWQSNNKFCRASRLSYDSFAWLQSAPRFCLLSAEMCECINLCPLSSCA